MLRMSPSAGIEAFSLVRCARRYCAWLRATEFRRCGVWLRRKREAAPESDLDLLIDLEDGRRLFSLIAGKQEIKELIGRKVDIVTDDSLRGPRGESILRMQPHWEAIAS